MMAVSMLIITPKNKVTEKPMTKLAPNRCANQNRIAHVIIVEKLPSLMAGHARSNPTSTADRRDRPDLISSFKRSRRSLKWQERKRRIKEGIMRTEWNVEDGQLVIIKTPTKKQRRLKYDLERNNLQPGQTGIIIDMKDVLPSAYKKDGKNKTIIVLVY